MLFWCLCMTPEERRAYRVGLWWESAVYCTRMGTPLFIASPITCAAPALQATSCHYQPNHPAKRPEENHSSTIDLFPEATQEVEPSLQSFCSHFLLRLFLCAFLLLQAAPTKACSPQEGFVHWLFWFPILILSLPHVCTELGSRSLCLVQSSGWFLCCEW